MLVFIVAAISLCVVLAEKGAPDESGLILAVVAGLVVGMFFCRNPWAEYCQAIFDGMSQPVGVIAVICWVWAGMFAKVLAAGGLVEGLVWLGGATGFSGGLFAMATFLLAALFATAVGTGYGTTIAFCQLLYPAGMVLGADPIMLFAAILSGAAFGDNLAPVSDTTIVSAVTQETDVPGVVRSRFKYAVTAAIPAALLFLLFGGGGQVDAAQAGVLIGRLANPAGLILLVPFGLVIYLALSGRHIVVSITWGILVAIGLILLSNIGFVADVLGGPLAEPGKLLFVDVEARAVTGALTDGINGFVKMSILILFIVTAGHIMNVGGALEGIKRGMMKIVKTSVRRAELVIVSTVAALNVFITVNTAAEIAAAPFVRDMGKAFRLHPYRRANFLDAVSSAFGYIFPWSGGVLLGVATLRDVSAQYAFVGAPPSPMDVWPYVFHGWLLAAVMAGAAATGLGRRYAGPAGEPLVHPPGEEGSRTA
ncbi:MAG: Na+/H+ antiporter NhaC family protein [Deltaproteobacteria bacterium]|nr:Na+/H+ antiporter NhaC family protein [Deltaproteobacteria bacterium]